MATIVSRTHPKWLRAELYARNRHGKSLQELGWEGEVLHAIERGEDPVRVCNHLTPDDHSHDGQEIA